MSKYYINEHYFDQIDSPDKAYWLGFIWCDGYILKRSRGSFDEYSLKISLKQSDKEHLDKLVASLDSNMPVTYQKLYSGFGEIDSLYPRLLITRKHLAMTLYYKYGIVPYRTDISAMMQEIPRIYYRDFMRGIFDADGTIIAKNVHHKKVTREEFSIGLSTNQQLVALFNQILIDEELTPTRYKITQRHQGADGDCRSIRITGNNKVYQILSWLYKDNEIALNRKELSYIRIKEYMDEYERGNVRYGS